MPVTFEVFYIFRFFIKNGENKQLDNPLTEKELIEAISRQFGKEITKHVVVKKLEQSKNLLGFCVRGKS